AEDRVPPEGRGAHEESRRIQRILAPLPLLERGRRRRVLGVPRARRDHGPDAEALLQATITRDARRLSVGQVTYTAVCNEAGGMIDDATVFRLGQDNFRFVGGDDYDGD